MSKFNIIRACGHEEKIQIYGPSKDRDRKAEWEGARDCYECYASKKVAEFEAKKNENRAAAENLPPLSGSEKQISWAIDIRAAAHRKLPELRKIASNSPTPDMQSLAHKLLDEYFRRHSSKEWIESRQDELDIRWFCNLVRARAALDSEISEIVQVASVAGTLVLANSPALHKR